MEFGDYAGLDYFQGRVRPVWADTSNSTGNNPNVNARFDAMLDSVSSAPPAPPAMRFFSIHAGVARPHGVLNTTTNQGWTLNLDYVRTINFHWAWDLRLGVSHFPGSGPNPNVNAWNLTPNVRYTINPPAVIRAFVNGGIDGYYFDPGNAEGGVNLGIGLNRPINPTLQLELTYNYHWALTASPTLRYSQLQFGALWAF